MSFGSFRTIWISIRAANYTTRAFQDSIRGLKKVEQQEIAQQLRAKRNILAMSALYLSFSLIAVNSIVKVMKASAAGQNVLDRFSQRTSKAMARIGDAFAAILGPVLEVLAGILEFVTANPVLNLVAAGITLVAIGLFTAWSAGKLFAASLALVHVLLGKVAVKATVVGQQTLPALIPNLRTTTAATWSLASALQAVVIGFTAGFAIVSTVATLFGRTPAIIASVITAIAALIVIVWQLAAAQWSVAGAMSVITFGAAALAGGAAIAGVIAASSPDEDFGLVGSFATGTSYVRKSGLAMVHEGEEIGNARTKSRMSSQPYTRTSNQISVTINGNIQTRADNEELAPMISRAIRKELGNKV